MPKPNIYLPKECDTVRIHAVVNSFLSVNIFIGNKYIWQISFVGMDLWLQK